MVRPSHFGKLNPRLLMIILIVDVIVVLAIVGWFYYKSLPPPAEPRKVEEFKADLEKGEQALGLLENERFAEATPLWVDLCQRFPEDPNLALNLAICRLGRVEKQLREIASSDKVTPEDRQKLQNEIPELLNAAEKSAAEALRLAPNSPVPNRVTAAIRLELANRQEYPADIEYKKQAANFLIEALKRVPGDPVLAIQLHDLSQELEADAPELARQSAEALYAAWKKLPRNLFLLQLTGDALLTLRDTRIQELLEPSIQLNKPFMDQILANAAGEDPIAGVELAKKAMETGKYDEAELPLRQWFNLHKGTAAFTADRRFANPNILAMISLDTINRWRAELSEALTKERKSDDVVMTWEERPLPALPNNSDRLRGAIWYDIDLDLAQEVACIQGNQLTVRKLPTDSETNWEVYSSIDIDPTTKQLYAIDLFSVTVGDQPRVNASTAKELAQASGAKDEEATTVASRRHDTLQDLVLLNDQGIQIVTTLADPNDNKKRILTAVTTPTGLEDVPGISRLEPFDIDGDGDLDVAVIANGKVRLFQNNGNRTFKSLDSWSELLPSEVMAQQIIACDYDRDIDTDLLVACEGKVFGILENLLHSQCRWRILDGPWSELQNGSDLTVAELDGNASWDWSVVQDSKMISLLTRTPSIGETVPSFSDTAKLPVVCTGLYTADFNNDSWNDSIAWGSQGLVAIAGKEGGRWASANSTILADPIQYVSVADIDQKGQLSILATTNNGLKLITCKPANDAGYLDVRLKGIDDENGGGRVNHYGYGSTLELRAGERYLAQIVRQPATHFGLGNINKVDTLRVIFTNGLTQSAIAPTTENLAEEVQAPKGSCPFLYGWDGEKFVMITDLLWNAPLGLQIARGKVLPDRRWEYLILPGEKMQPKDGNYEIRITEELWEAAYFDEVRLMAIDHPAEVEVFTNEKVGPPDIAAHRIFTASHKRYPQKTLDSAGRDWTEAVSKKDAVYAYGFTRNYCQGLVDKHYLELDFGELPEHKTAQLVLTGWLFPTDTSLNISLDDNPDLSTPVPPSLWLSQGQDEFQCIRPFMGFPGGKPKPIVIDLTNDMRAGPTRLRIETSAQLHWDEAFLVLDEGQVEIHEQNLSLTKANLHYRGFSTLKPRTFEQPHWYDYNQLDATAGWPYMEGYFTNYGEVLELLKQDDNRLVVMGSGDEMTLTFALPETPLPAGWKRDFVLYSTGWDKDADLNTLEGQSSLPLPFKEMEAYPPPVQQIEKAEEVWKLNRPNLRRQQSFRSFWKIATESSR
jgi:hypothetical protein